MTQTSVALALRLGALVGAGALSGETIGAGALGGGIFRCGELVGSGTFGRTTFVKRTILMVCAKVRRRSAFTFAL